jgi:hypothetical protein
VPGVNAAEDVIAGLILGHLVVQSMLDKIAGEIVEKINNMDDISKFLHWLKRTWSARNVITFVLLYCLLWASLGIWSMSAAAGGFAGLGLSLTIILVGLLAGIGLYAIVWVTWLASNLKEYQYEMNLFYPLDSEIVHDISAMLSNGIYLLAVYFAIITLIASSDLIGPPIRTIFSLPLFLIAWTIMITQFLLARSTIGSIANKARWTILNKLQSKINSIAAAEDLSDKEPSERLLRLANIHRQVMAAKTQIFDLKSLSIFFSQLMLPLLGLLLANLDEVTAFLR